MNKQQQVEALLVARKVKSGKLTRASGARLLSESAGIRLGSAGIVIAVYLSMNKGQVLKRTLSATDMDFLVGSIADDEGAAQLAKALMALKLHISIENLMAKIRFRTELFWRSMKFA